ncbi:hypothetical protein FKX85_02230 [Echinicola soli]|uniref:Extracellular endo-alpha-(1->5)-L-arabinanase C-terminal domain-containing protein n=1 Tax=Echinicola soli TaxID=2591634 RepID=A0A514CDM1_9BACT|nr:glycoside hydrolase family 43 C-terminal domain-containing protein [Echinicola soli]QDH77921.1 hypothetical protein FKX85_02230 [Echinicola soli]
MGYQVIPGFATEQADPDFQSSYEISLDENGTIDGEQENRWSFDAPWLTLNIGNGIFIDKLRVQNGYDWKNHQETLLFTGLNNEGTAIFGKKK